MRNKSVLPLHPTKLYTYYRAVLLYTDTKVDGEHLFFYTYTFTTLTFLSRSEGERQARVYFRVIIRHASVVVVVAVGAAALCTMHNARICPSRKRRISVALRALRFLFSPHLMGSFLPPPPKDESHRPRGYQVGERSSVTCPYYSSKQRNNTRRLGMWAAWVRERQHQPGPPRVPGLALARQ